MARKVGDFNDGIGQSLVDNLNHHVEEEQNAQADSYEIVGVYRGRSEVIDVAESKQDAAYLVGEYRMAYGNQWDVFSRKAKR